MTLSYSEAPSISVLLSCYNGERWLAAAIESVLGQTFKDFEFLIVDDGSTDNSASIIKDFAEQDRRIIVLTKPNTGLADSLNLGIQRARGDWIARIDADDIAEPARLEMQLAKASESPDFVFVGTGLVIVDENGRSLKTYRYPDRHPTLVRNLRTARRFPPHSSAFYRTEAVRSVGGYRTRIRRAEDRDLWLRLSEIGRLTALSEPLVRIRKHASQISREDAGKAQKIDSEVAMVSYWLRRTGHSDPVSEDRDVFQRFRAWVEARLEQDRLFELADYTVSAKMKIAVSHETPMSVMDLALHLVKRPQLFARALHTYVAGENFSRRLASEWSLSSKQGEPG